MVLLEVANRPWQKEGSREITSSEDRLALVSAAVEGVAGLRASRLEIDRGGESYTADTLAELARLHPGAELFTIVGSDAAAGLLTWERYDEVAQPFAPRGGGAPGSRPRAAGRGDVDQGRRAAPRGVEHRPPNPGERRSTARLPGARGRAGRGRPAEPVPISVSGPRWTLVAGLAGRHRGGVRAGARTHGGADVGRQHDGHARRSARDRRGRPRDPGRASSSPPTEARSWASRPSHSCPRARAGP